LDIDRSVPLFDVVPAGMKPSACMATSPGGASGQRLLPIFPLSTVLFPGAALPLHIFEQRYRAMIRRCLEAPAHEFVVCLIKEGDEVVEPPTPDAPPGRPAIPHDVGTTARILEAHQLPDGRYYIVCLGGERIRLRRLVQREPYLVGAVEPFPDEAAPTPTQDPAELAARMRGAVERLLATLKQALAARPEQRRQVQELARAVPADARGLSFFVPRVLTLANAQEQQRLLEATSAHERLRLVLPFVYREQKVLEQDLALSASEGPGAGIHRPSVN
jgi:Lon protease-like protein